MGEVVSLTELVLRRNSLAEAEIDLGTDDETVMEKRSWKWGARCAGADYEAFFPEKGGSTREAKQICRECIVRSECLQAALDNDERFGVWGGYSERERRKMRSRRIV
ncbi:WhiB family transcription factor [Gordonia phage Skog]|uniref:WhiB family transcription factor n=1 Tax=Gordonia phage Skog TaxID=2704033 RepID=A0A6G6XJR3_9CAUD|nr:WhiB family transcription factor [Gordonia phage Skog]QIG58266.1 WhiB family transcription factor [Gordonia phage Skog]